MNSIKTAFLSACLCGSVVYAAPPPMKYECVATLGQERLPGGGHDHVSAKTKPFIVTEADFYTGIELDLSDFVDFISTEESEILLGDGSRVRAKGRKTFAESELKHGFGLWMTIRGPWGNAPEYERLDLATLFSIVKPPAGKGAADALGVRGKTSGEKRPKTLETDLTVYLSMNSELSGPIHVGVHCKDKLP